MSPLCWLSAKTYPFFLCIVLNPPSLIERELVITRGTIDCALFALEYGCALNIAGGTHHAFAERGEGFCLLNDMAIAADYLLYKKLAMLLETVNPDFIFYLSGVDILSTDKFGKFNVSIDECKRRDELVLKMAYDNKIPIAIAMGGGYSPDINDILQAHCNTFRIAANLF